MDSECEQYMELAEEFLRVEAESDSVRERLRELGYDLEVSMEGGRKFIAEFRGKET